MGSRSTAARLRRGGSRDPGHQFVNGRKSYSDIRRQLNEAGIANHNGRAWTDGMIPTILANENYIGKTVYNRTSRRLGQKLVKNPDHTWSGALRRSSLSWTPASSCTPRSCLPCAA
ncbi:recombinase family protein [Bradyrhizobium sp. CW4]|nr:recombinase family protein [Bradyrhizobium sp. CW4]MCK1571749.1 recombinase family protein [Bradyrhizobium sp. 174]